eukprot:COSAG01_NODE_7635_length_3119_cov_1.967550_5_plen_109_part_00
MFIRRGHTVACCCMLRAAHRIMPHIAHVLLASSTTYMAASPAQPPPLRPALPPLCGTSPLQVSKVTAMSTTTTTATTTAAGGATTTVTTTTTAPEDPALFHGGNPELA